VIVQAPTNSRTMSSVGMIEFGARLCHRALLKRMWPRDESETGGPRVGRGPQLSRRPSRWVVPGRVDGPHFRGLCGVRLCGGGAPLTASTGKPACPGLPVAFGTARALRRGCPKNGMGSGMKRAVRVAVIVPAGPRDDIFDTIESVVQYCDPSRVVVVIDDRGLLSGDGARRLTSLSADVQVIPAPPAPGGLLGGLWVKTCAGYCWLLDHYEPGLVLRMDADALMIGPGIEQMAEEEFAKDSGVGLLGAYRLGPDDGPRDFSWPAAQIRRSVGLQGLLRPRQRSFIRGCYRLAQANGYVAGEHVLASASIHRYEAIKAVDERGWLRDAYRLRNIPLGDDHVMSMLTMAAGFKIGDFSASTQPMALTWRGLPAHPVDLLSRGKLVTHSVRSWADLSEAEIRSIFAAARAVDAGTARDG
jgi:hypothetical protein